MGRQREKRWFALFLVVLLLVAGIPAEQLYAEEKLAVTKESLTLYVGNTYQLEVTGATTDDWGFTNVSFYSSDTSVVSVDWYGELRALSAGTAVITVYGESSTAQCKVKVKKNSYEISEESLTLYTDQEASLTMSGGKKAKSYDYFVINQEYGGMATWYFDVEMDGKGGFTFTSSLEGSYYLYLVANATDGRSYAVRCAVTVEDCGPEKSSMAVAVGKKKELSVQNATNISFVSGDTSIVKIDKDGMMTGVSEGIAQITVTYTTPNDTQMEETCGIWVTNPVYTKFEGNLIAGEYYYPELSGTSYNSEIVLSSSKEDVVQNYYGSFYAASAGTSTLKIEVDGITFKQKVKVIDPQLSQESIVLLKGKTKYLKVSGVEEDSVITFSSSNSKVAKISSKGKITAKKQGTALITVTIDGYEMYCTVCVGSGKGVTAAQKGAAVLGAAYSQAKRMQKGYYDCSSFVWRSYQAAGIELGGVTYAPTAAELAKKLESEGKAIAYEYVEPDELKPGDLIFYRGSSNGRYMNIDHVAMYYGPSLSRGWYGESYNAGMVIHASGNVHMRQYSEYRVWDIVMIVRPV